MKLDEIVAWYQKKIGTYDKQQWEKTVEQKILDGFSCFPLKNAKVKTEFIDVDLVRGSTFPKAKAKEPLFSVIRLAFLRYIFLPVYAKWWVAQTSPNIFAFLLFLYTTQMLNWAIYSFNTHRSGDDIEHIVSVSELLIPMILSFILSLVHSQIVATNTGNSMNGQTPKHVSNVQRPRDRERTRRRKKLVKIRYDQQDAHTKSNGRKNPSDPCNLTDNKKPLTLNFLTDVNLKNNIKTPYPSDANDENKSECVHCLLANCTTHNNKKRNVNWDSPIYNYASELLSPPSNNNNCSPCRKTESEKLCVCNKEFPLCKSESDSIDAQNDSDITIKCHPIDDDGFESLNGKSSSGDEILLSVKNVGESSTTDCTLRHRPSTTQNKGNEAKENRSDICDKIQEDVYKYHKLKSEKSSKDVDQSTDEESDDGDISSPQPKDSSYLDGTTSTNEWLGITTNSEECSYSSEIENSDNHQQSSYDEDFTPNVILNPHGSLDRISCTVWQRQDVKKAEMSVLDISSCIIERVEAMPESCDYIYIGLVFSTILSLLPLFCRLCEATVDSENSTEINYFHLPKLLLEKASFSFLTILVFAFGESKWETTVLTIGFIQRLFLTFIVFFLLAVSEKTFKQRFLYAKLFSHLTSSRRARKSDLPHFRLNKVRNIKTWLSVRSYLKRRGPQRSVDVIVSAAFIVTLLLLSFLSLEWLKDSVHLHSQINLEALLWSSALGIFLLRFMTLGNKINRKYRSISVLITEQINLYLQIEQKPQKKDDLMVSNSVLKLAADLLKELESPFKISGLSANPYLYTTIKVVILSALSGVLSEMLGFKLKLHKIKIK